VDIVIDRVIVRHRSVFPVRIGAFRHFGAAKQQSSSPKAGNGNWKKRLTASGAGISLHAPPDDCRGGASGRGKPRISAGCRHVRSAHRRAKSWRAPRRKASSPRSKAGQPSPPVVRQKQEIRRSTEPRSSKLISERGLCGDRGQEPYDRSETQFGRRIGRRNRIQYG
jgi:hypothetical protein